MSHGLKTFLQKLVRSISLLFRAKIGFIMTAGCPHSVFFFTMRLLKSQQEPQNEIDDWCDWCENCFVWILVQLWVWDSLSFDACLRLNVLSLVPSCYNLSFVCIHLLYSFQSKSPAGAVKLARHNYTSLFSTCNFPVGVSRPSSKLSWHKIHGVEISLPFLLVRCKICKGDKWRLSDQQKGFHC